MQPIDGEMCIENKWKRIRAYVH